MPARSVLLPACAVLLAALPATATAKTIVGTPGPDRLVSTSATGDTIFGGGGADTLIGGPGNDVIYGVRAGNTIDAAGGDNFVEGGPGSDRITGGDGRNTVYGGGGSDTIALGNGNNYVDPGGARDQVTLGNGNNVVNAGLGGMVLHAGSGDNTVFYREGPDEITLGGGTNRVYLARVDQFALIDCGGNPASVLYVNAAVDPTLALVRSAQLQGKVTGCPTITTFTGLALPVKTIADPVKPFRLVGTPAADLLYGGSGGGSIRGLGGDNVLHAEHVTKSSPPMKRSTRVRLTAGNGNNEIYGGGGTNRIKAGKGRNFIKAGAWNNRITTRGGNQTIRLSGKGRNVVTIIGGRAYVESFVSGTIVPEIRCVKQARVIVVYGARAPRTNCPTAVPASSKLGKRLQVNGVVHVADSSPVIAGQPLPGDGGIGLPRPAITG